MTDTQPPQQDSLAAIFGEPIYCITRKMLIDDGVLYDVTPTANEAGIAYPVAITAAVHSLCRVIPESLQGVQSYEGRLWDVLWMLRCAIPNHHGTDRFTYQLIMDRNEGGRRLKRLELAAICSPGDDGEPVITVGTDWSDLD